MTATYPQATDQISNAFWTKFNSSEVSALCGYVPEVRWQYVPEPAPPDASNIWARFSIQTIGEAQKALSSEVSETGKRRYTAFGLIFVQLFLPKSDMESGDKGRKLAAIVKAAFQGKTTSGHVLFRNSRIQELPPEEQFHRINVVSEFEYDEIA